MSDSLLQIIYISAASPDFDENELTDLLLKARINNTKLGITGMLLYHERSFVQVLTGPEEKVMPLFNKIGKDKRHDQCQMLSKSYVDERSFEDWSMGFYKSHANSEKELPGFNNVLKAGFVDCDDNADRARKILLGFKEGRWRQVVSS